MTPEQPGPRPKFNPLRWIEPSLNGLVTFLLLIATWLLATSETGRDFRENLGWPSKLGLALLAGLFVLAITYWSNLRAKVEEQWMALAKTAGAIAPSLVKPALIFLLGAVLFTAYHVMKGSFEGGPTVAGVSMPLLGMLCLSATPALLTLGVSLLVERRMARGDFAFEANPSMIAGRKHGPELVKHAKANWEYEREIMEGSIHRMGRHAAILGFLASSVLVTCAAIWVSDNDFVALSVGTAATISFTLHLGQIFFRSASNDATARMMARASRTLLIVSICALFFGALFLEASKKSPLVAPQSVARASRTSATPEEAAGAGTAPDEGSAPNISAAGDTERGAGNPLRGRTGALLIGVAVALIGERMLRVVTNRAASMLGLEGFAAPQSADLNAIDGLSEEDAARLSEERIDSVHALAFTPTARIFFNTVYGLPRICDWQDQALLIERVGRTNALLLREQFFIRGAISARRLALQKFGAEEMKKAEAKQSEQSPSPEPAAPVVADATKAAGDAGKTAANLEWLGLDKESHLDRALRSLVDDENIQMLEIFWRSVPVLKMD